MQKGEKVPYFPNYLLTAGEHGEHSCPHWEIFYRNSRCNFNRWKNMKKSRLFLWVVLPQHCASRWRSWRPIRAPSLKTKVTTATGSGQPRWSTVYIIYIYKYKYVYIYIYMSWSTCTYWWLEPTNPLPCKACETKVHCTFSIRNLYIQ